MTTIPHCLGGARFEGNGGMWADAPNPATGQVTGHVAFTDEFGDSYAYGPDGIIIFARNKVITSRWLTVPCVGSA